MEGRLVAVKGDLSAALVSDLAAVPGAPVALHGMAWAIRVGPDRAESIATVAERHGVDVSPGAREALAGLRSERDLDDPVVELVTADGASWLSLMGDWLSLALEELRAVPGSRARAAAGRVEVPLTGWTAEPIKRTVAAHGIRLSPTAAAALREIGSASVAGGGDPAAARGADRAVAPRGADPGAGRRADPTAGLDAAPSEPAAPAPTPCAPTVSMDGGGLLVAAAQGHLGRVFAGLPGARAWGPGRWLAPSTPTAARALRCLAPDHPELIFTPEAQRWLEQAPRWIARIDVDPADAPPAMRITTRWGEPPPELGRLEALATLTAHRTAPLSTGNLELLRRIVAVEGEVSLAPTVERALQWVAAHPEAAAVPPAELDLVEEPEGRRLRVESIWDEEPERAFAEQELALLRRHRELAPTATELPAAAWPPETLARFVRIHGVGCTPPVARLIEGALTADADAERLIALSSAADADVTVPGLGGDLMPFQRAGVAYALERRRLFLADEQGLGKTIQALATVQCDQAYPAVVICPASLKLNWLREIRAWLPERTAQAVAGRSKKRLEGADVYVLNYEVVGAHLDALRVLAPQALILDESHYVKNAKAARTKAVLELADGLGPDALRLALTGTPIVNRPAELAPQLRAIDRLREYGSANSFKHAYGSESARRRLHQRLRSSCYLRRRKTDVLAQLPAKRRAVITVPLDNESEYRRAERDFVRWLADQLAAGAGADADAAAATGRLAPSARAQAVVRMTALRRLAARGKLAAALSWVEDFLESEERLVLFAHHRDVQAAVLERFPASSRIVGADVPAAREENVRRFQADDGPQLCVCSLEVGAHGFTLTRAANVAFLELAWTPAKHDQAEDRVHRIGQTGAVTAWYLLAAGTIDERIAALLEAKREVVDSLTDGGSGDGQSLAAAILAGYAADAPGGAPTESSTRTAGR